MLEALCKWRAGYQRRGASGVVIKPVECYLIVDRVLIDYGDRHVTLTP